MRLTNVIDILHHQILCQHIILQYNSTHSDQLGSLGKCVKDSTKLTCLEFTSYWIKHRLLELQMKCGRNIQLQVHAVNVMAELQTANVAYFQRNIQFSRFFAYPEGLLSHLVKRSGDLLYYKTIHSQFLFMSFGILNTN